jgi:phosphoribosyl-dephospho-CoA transferase
VGILCIPCTADEIMKSVDSRNRRVKNAVSEVDLSYCKPLGRLLNFTCVYGDTPVTVNRKHTTLQCVCLHVASFCAFSQNDRQ